MMQLSGAKMSKSLGNLVTIDNFLKEYEANVLRLMILNSSYRGPLTFNEETIEHAQKALKRLRSALKPALPQEGWEAAKLEHSAGTVQQEFLQAMDDDFNTAGALGHIFDFVKEINQARDEGADQASLEQAQGMLKELTGVLGLDLELPPVQEGAAGEFIELLIEVRAKLREEKNWALSDLIRDQLEDLGVTLEDSPQGTIWQWK
jgi:cysteinyl-tRNA synthetase